MGEMIPSKIAEMGINLSMKKRYVRGALVVLKAQIMETDAVKMMSNVKSEEAGAKMKELQDALAFLELEDAQKMMSLQMMKKSREKLMEKLVDLLPEKLAEAAGAKIEVNALSEEHQAEWFFSFLESH